MRRLSIVRIGIILAMIIISLVSVVAAYATTAWASGTADCDHAWVTGYGAGNGGAVREVRGDTQHWFSEEETEYHGTIWLHIWFPEDENSNPEGDEWLPASWSGYRPTNCEPQPVPTPEPPAQPPVTPEPGPGEPEPTPEEPECPDNCPPVDPVLECITFLAAPIESLETQDGDTLSTPWSQFFNPSTSEIVVRFANGDLGSGLLNATLNNGETIQLQMHAGFHVDFGTWWQINCYRVNHSSVPPQAPLSIGFADLPPMPDC